MLASHIKKATLATALGLFCGTAPVLGFFQQPVAPAMKNKPVAVTPQNVYVPIVRPPAANGNYAKQLNYRLPQQTAGYGMSSTADRFAGQQQDNGQQVPGDAPMRDPHFRMASFDEAAVKNEPQVPEILRGNKPILPSGQGIEAARSHLQRTADTSAVPPTTAPNMREPIVQNQQVVARPGTMTESSQPSPGITGLPSATVDSTTSSPAMLAKDQPAKLTSTPSGAFTRVNMTDEPKASNMPADVPSSLMAAQSQSGGGVVVPALKMGNDKPTAMQTDASVSPAAVYLPAIAGSPMKPDRTETQGSANFSMVAPMIQVDTFGPKTIGILKKSQFKVVARNQSSIDAERVNLAITLPNWIRIENVNATTGRKEVTDDQKSSRIIWSIDRISANSTQTITIDAVPAKAEMFDFQVEMVQQPRNGVSHVQVTEPRLDMKIAGPNEVMYGETATYQVAVRNPGTGTAENVVVMLPEALGGERATLGDIGPGEEKNFRVELMARTAGVLDLATSAAATGNLQTSAAKQILVRRAALLAEVKGPEMKYAGSVGMYDVEIKNSGDATARDVVAALALPNGVSYVEGIDAVDVIESGLRWSIGTLDAGDSRRYRIAMQLNVDGQVQMELGARGQGDIAAVGQVTTFVETVADLTLLVEDPKGPLPTGQDVDYSIRIRNRGTKSANGLNLVMQFSEGVEPTSASGQEHQLTTGQVVFDAIKTIEPGEEIVVRVAAKAVKSGTHIFRAQLTCSESDERDVSEGTTQFYGNDAPTKSNPPTSVGGGSFSSELKR